MLKKWGKDITALDTKGVQLSTYEGKYMHRCYLRLLCSLRV